MMGMIVVVTVTVIVSAGGYRKKNDADATEFYVFAGEKLLHGGIVRHAQGIRQHLHAEVEIAETPADLRRLFQARNRNFQHLFRRLLNDVIRIAHGKKVGAMVDRLVEIKAKSFSVPGHAAPAPLGESRTRGCQGDVVMRSVNPVRMWIILNQGKFGHGDSGELDHIPTRLVFKIRGVKGEKGSGTRQP